jgi:hypothetical protein
MCGGRSGGSRELYNYIFRSKARKGVCVFVFHSRGLFFFTKALPEEEQGREKKMTREKKKLGN